MGKNMKYQINKKHHPISCNKYICEEDQGAIIRDIMKFHRITFCEILKFDKDDDCHKIFYRFLGPSLICVYYDISNHSYDYCCEEANVTITLTDQTYLLSNINWYVNIRSTLDDNKI